MKLVRSFSYIKWLKLISTPTAPSQRLAILMLLRCICIDITTLYNDTRIDLNQNFLQNKVQ